LSLSRTKNAAELQGIKDGIRTQARFICWSIVTANLVSIVLLAQFRYSAIALLIISLVVFGGSLLQMVLSLLFLLKRALGGCLYIFFCRVLCCQCDYDTYIDKRYTPGQQQHGPADDGGGGGGGGAHYQAGDDAV